MKTQNKILSSFAKAFLVVALFSGLTSAASISVIPAATKATSEKSDRKPAGFDPEIGPFWTMTFEEMGDLHTETLDPAQSLSREHIYLKKLLVRLQNLPLKNPILPEGPGQGVRKLGDLASDMKSWDDLRKEIYDLCSEKKSKFKKTCEQMKQDREDTFNALSADHNPHDRD